MKKLISPAIRAEHQKKKKGFTLTEIAIVLGIVGLILGAIWTAAAAVYNNQRNAHANTAILQIVQGIRTLTANSNNDTGITTAVLISAGAVPSDLVNAAGTGLNGPWANSTITVNVPATADSFTLDITGVPKSSCVDVIEAVAGQSRDPGLFAIQAPTAGGGGITGYTGVAIATAAPLTVSPSHANVIAGCTAAVGNIAFGFSLK